MTDHISPPNILPDDCRFDGKSVLVTGASAGCGLAIAQGFARRHARVILVGRTLSTLEAACADIRAKGGDAVIINADVTDAETMAREIAALPRLDILVNNAGTNIPEAFLEVSRGNLRALTRLNMRATFLITQAAIAKMRERADLAREGGAIINITSQMGHIGAPERVAYCTTKHALEGLTKALAVELAPENIRVNSVAPTFVDTPLIRRIVDTPEKRDALLSLIPMGRMASAEDVAFATMYLASPNVGLVTGVSLRVDGGWCAR